MPTQRARSGSIAALGLSLVFGAGLVGLVTFDLYMMSQVPTAAPLPFTVRVPPIGIYRDTITGGASYRMETVREGRGDTVDPKRARLIQAYEEFRRPPSQPLLLGLAAVVILLSLLFLGYLRAQGRMGQLLSTQLTLLFSLLLFGALGKALMLFSAWSALWIPLVALALPATLHLGRRVGVATGLALAIIISLLNPIDLPALFVFGTQALVIGAVVRPRGGKRMLALGAFLASLAGVLSYAAISLLLVQYVPMGSLSQGLTIAAFAHSDLFAAGAGPIAGGVLALLLSPAFRRLSGQLSPATLGKLANFEHPLLRRLSTRAPGTWAHSLNMANYAEMAANAIGADGQLVRVGAYYHDLGKSIEPEYFIENQTGENPHDTMPPEVSADAIFSHVKEGIALARKHKVPEPIIEFIYTHHATDRLEFFWHKNVKAGNKRNLTERDFSYRGIRPQTKETGILAICDAVEAASRTLSSPKLEDLKRLVRQIIFTKLEKRILDDCGLTVGDLRRIADSLVETLRSALHSRVKYPWQEEQEQRDAEEAPTTLLKKGPAQATTAPDADVQATGPTPKRAKAVAKSQPHMAPPLIVESQPLREPTGSKEPAWVESPEVPTKRRRAPTQPLGGPDDSK